MLYPTAFDSEKVCSLTDSQFRLWAWMLTQADDDGRGQWWPMRAASGSNLKNPTSISKVTADAQSICDINLATIYSVNGFQFYQMHDWSDYQYIRSDRYKPSTYPCQPNGNQPGTERGQSGDKTGTSSTSINTTASTKHVANEATGVPELPLNIKRSEESHLREYHQWIAKLKGEVGDDALVDYFINAMVTSVDATYSSTGGRFTNHKKGRLARRMLPYGCEPSMFSIEVFCDKYAGIMDERYLYGIARKANRLSEKELEKDIDRHRAQMGDRGLFYEATHAQV